MPILCPNSKNAPRSRWSLSGVLSLATFKCSPPPTPTLKAITPVEDPPNPSLHLLSRGRFADSLSIGDCWRRFQLAASHRGLPFLRHVKSVAQNLTEIWIGPMILTRLARWSRMAWACRHALAQGDLVMTVVPMLTRRLLRTKQAATYLSMSEWKLRRLIQNEIIPFVQDQRGGPFLVDVRDLDAYIESNKHNIGDSLAWEPHPVSVATRQAVPQLRGAK